MRLLKVFVLALCVSGIAYAQEEEMMEDVAVDSMSDSTSDSTNYGSEMTREATSTYQTTGQTVGAFNNNLNSTTIVSPAQIYHIGGMRTDWQLGFGNEKYKVGNADIKANGTMLNGAFVNNFSEANLRAGVMLDYLFGSSDAGGGNETDFSTWALKPTVAWGTEGFVLAAQAIVTGDAEEPKGGSKSDVTYVQFRPAVMYSAADYEVGVAFTTKQDKDATADKLEVKAPANLTLHGRYAISPNFAMGGVLDHVGHKALDPTDSVKDQIKLKATAEFDQTDYKIETSLGYNTKFHDKTGSASADNISTMEIGVGGDFRINEGATLGGAINWGFGSETVNSVKYEANNFALGIRTNFVL